VLSEPSYYHLPIRIIPYRLGKKKKKKEKLRIIVDHVGRRSVLKLLALDPDDGTELVKSDQEKGPKKTCARTYGKFPFGKCIPCRVAIRVEATLTVPTRNVPPQIIL